jgi:hypothetical protein
MLDPRREQDGATGPDLLALFRGPGEPRGVELDTVIGLIVLAAALAVLGLLTFWSRRTIERIAARHLGSLREVIRDLGRERR